MPKFEYYQGKMRSQESIAYLKAIAAGEEAVTPPESVQPIFQPRRDIPEPELDELADDAIDEAKPLTRGQKAAATRAANREAAIAKEARKAEPLRPTNVDEDGNAVVKAEVKDPETGEVKQIVLPPADQEPVIGPNGETEEDIEAAIAAFEDNDATP
jgi:hypothetical protein